MMTTTGRKPAASTVPKRKGIEKKPREVSVGYAKRYLLHSGIPSRENSGVYKSGFAVDAHYKKLASAEPNIVTQVSLGDSGPVCLCVYRRGVRRMNELKRKLDQDQLILPSGPRMEPFEECDSCSLDAPRFITPFVPGINVAEVLNLHCNKHGLKKNPVYVKATGLNTAATQVESGALLPPPPLIEDGFVVVDSGLTHGELDKLIEELVENSKHWPEYNSENPGPVICNPDPAFRHTLGGFSALVGLSSVYNKVSRRIKQQMHAAVIPVIRGALEYLYGQDASKFYVRAICDRLLYRPKTNAYQGDAAHQDISPNFFEKILGSFLNMNPDHTEQTFSCFKGHYLPLDETFGPGTSSWASSKKDSSSSGFVKSKIEGLAPTNVAVPFGKIVLFWSDIIHVVHKSSKKEILRMFEGFGLTLNRQLWIDKERVTFDLANLTPPKLPSGDEHSIYSATHASLQLDAVEKFFKETMNPCLAVCPYLPSLMYFVDHGILSHEDFEKYFGEFSASEACAYFYAPINQ